MQPENLLLQPDEYWDVCKRHLGKFTAAFSTILLASIALAMLLPAVYRSESTILIQRQSIPSNMVATTVTGYVQEQIEQIKQRIISRDLALEIADQFALYPQEFATDPSLVVTKVRENIEVKTLQVNASDPTQNGIRTATIAFTVAYSSEIPETAQAVTADIAERFILTHQEMRTELAEDVSEFLEVEAENLKAEIADLEEQLAGFKQGEMRQLPEMMSMNLNLFERTEQQIQLTEDRIRQIQQQIEASRAELSLTEPYEAVRTEDGRTIMTASQRLSMLTAAYLESSSRYSSQHPDIVRLSREIRILAEQTGDFTRVDELMGQLIALQEQLRQARQSYEDSHPEVARLETAIAAVQKGMQSSLVTPENANSELAIPPDNPRYVAIKTQLDASELNLEAEQAKLTELKEKLTEYETRLFQTPIVERDYRALSRGYEDALRKFSELNQKLLQAEIAETLEEGSRAEQWEIIGAAYLPGLPESPNRLGIILLGVLLALTGGLAVMAISEYSIKTVRSARRLTMILGTPPLATIPLIGTAHE